MSSTLVETVSINYEDFSDSFLTCGTCLCIYDSVDRTPKLLSCSHTVCQSCLEHIIEAQMRGSGNAGVVASFRCPICRETITVPRGGVAAFPPSFIVNQLLDLMGRQRRDVVPKCARHSQSELMFCETCDVVFCVDCAGASHAGSSQSSPGLSGTQTLATGNTASAHTVIPFSIAIKRMSEILLYKASLCMKNLDGAADNVKDEMRKLDEAGERCVEAAVKSFQEVTAAVDRRRDDIIATVRRIRDDKKRVLREQLEIIETERRRVRSDCDGLQSQVDVRNITSKISDLNEKLDMSATLVEPRENAFMAFEWRHNAAGTDISSALSQFGKVTISKTFPALCVADGTSLRQPIAAHLRSVVTVTTVDYHGNPRTGGGDPLSAELQCCCGKAGDAPAVSVSDNGDGTYTLEFTPTDTGTHQLYICIFDRPIKDSPFEIDVTDHIGPVFKAGGVFKQPVGVVVSRGTGDVYVLDAGNSRIAVLDSSLRHRRYVVGVGGLEERGAVGLAQGSESLVVVNWRTRRVTELRTSPGSDEPVVKQLTSASLKEPTSVALMSDGRLVVADNAVGRVFVIDHSGNASTLLSTTQLVNAVYCTPNDNVIVCHQSLQVFSADGRHLYDIGGSANVTRGTYSGVCMDDDGRYLATRTEKGRCMVQVFDSEGQWMFDIDSHGDRLRRPSGIDVDSHGFVYVADLGNDCIKKFPYM